MSEIKLNNGDEVVEALKSREALGMAPRGTVQKMVIEHCGGRAHISDKSVKANSQFIVDLWDDSPVEK